MAEIARPPHTSALRHFVGSIRGVVRQEPEPRWAAREIARNLEAVLAADEPLLTPDQCEPDESSYSQHILHVEGDGSFSVVALVWLPGQETPVHDHVSWCVTGVYRGCEHETRYSVETDAVSGDRYLAPTGSAVNEEGMTAALTPPGDIHRVRNRGPEKAVSIHVYGADIRRLGSSIRRSYDLAIREAG